MEGHEDVTGLDLTNLGLNFDTASSRSNTDPIPVPETEVGGILRRDLDERIKRSGLQFLGAAGLGAGMEMMDETARRQKERILLVWLFGWRDVLCRLEYRAPAADCWRDIFLVKRLLR